MKAKHVTEPVTHLQKQLYREAFAFVIGDIADIATLPCLHNNLMVRRSEKIELYSLAEATCRTVFTSVNVEESNCTAIYATAQIIGSPASHLEHPQIQQIQETVFSFMQSCIDIDQLQAATDSILIHDAFF